MLDPSLKAQNDSNYINMINYLISSLNKAKSATIPNQLHNKPIFLYEFFVFELYLPRELLRKIKQPLLAFRLLDFPTLTIQGSIVHAKESIVFNQGKSSYFEMEVSDLKEALINQPMYIMFVDLNHGDTKVIASSRLNISLFSYDSFLQYTGDTPKPRRNILKLFDNTLQKVAEFEMSLLIRREYYKYEINNFPLNQEKIIVNNPQYDNIRSSSSARPYSNELRVQSTDNIMKSDHIRMSMAEKAKKEFNEKLQKVDDQSQGQNYINYNDNECQTNNVNINNQYEKKESFNKEDFYAGSTYQPSLMELLSSEDRNPPPLYFHNAKRDENEKVIRVIHEERKNNESNENIKVLSESGVQTEEYVQRMNNSSMNQYKPKERKFYIKPKKTNQDIVNDMYTKTKERYDSYMKSQQINKSGDVLQKKNSLKKNSIKDIGKKHQPNQSNISESIKIEENLDESDNDTPNQQEEQQNEYLKLYSKVKDSQGSNQKSIRENIEGQDEYNDFDKNVSNLQSSNNNVIKNIKSTSIQEKIEGDNTYNDFDKNISSKINDESSYKFAKMSNDNIAISNIVKQSIDNVSIKPKQSLRRSLTASQGSIGNDSMIKSVLESVNNTKQKQTNSPIQEDSEAGYNDFESSEKKNRTTSMNNKSQEIPEDNIIKNTNSNSIKEDILSSRINSGNNTQGEIKEDIKDEPNTSNRKESIREDIVSDNKFNSINHQSTVSKGNDTNDIEELLLNSEGKI